jgi:hypothetical protein
MGQRRAGTAHGQVPPTGGNKLNWTFRWYQPLTLGIEEEKNWG